MKNLKTEHIEMSKLHFAFYLGFVVFLILASLFAGYYWGKKKACQDFIEICRADSLNDQIAVALCSYNEYRQSSEDQEQTDDEEVSDILSEVSSEQSSEDTKALEKNYFAELAGFGTLKAARNYAATLKKREVPAVILERCSKTSKGKLRNWYQVVTEPMDYETLQKIVEKIRVSDRLEGVSVLEFTRKYQTNFERIHS